LGRISFKKGERNKWFTEGGRRCRTDHGSNIRVGIALLFTLLVPAGYFAADVDPVQNAAFLADNQTVMFVWYLTIYVVFGVFLVALALALYERLKAGSPAMAQTATAFGLIWAGLMFASGMVANIGSGVVVDLYRETNSKRPLLM
jgi:hypothetical protein